MATITAMLPTLLIRFGSEWATETTTAGAPNDVETTDVRSWAVRYGRAMELEGVRAGTATIVLPNGDRAYEPGYTGGANYPDVIPWTPIHLTMGHTTSTPGSNNFGVFAGYVERWRNVYPGRDGQQLAIIEAVDPLAVLARYRVPAQTIAAGTADEQVGQVLTQIGWPAGTNRRDLDTTCQTDLEAYVTDGTEDALSVINRIVQSEDGLFYARPNDPGSTYGSTLVLKSRYNTALDFAFDAVFDDGGGEGTSDYRDLELLEGDDWIYNYASVAPQSGDAQTHSDSTSIDAYGERALSRSGLLLTENQCESLARWLVRRYKDPLAQVDTLTAQVVVGDEEAKLDAIKAAMQLDARVNVKRRPAGGTVHIVKGQTQGYSIAQAGPKLPVVYGFTLQSVTAEPSIWELDDVVKSLLGTSTYLGW